MEFLEVVLEPKGRGPLTIQDTVLQTDQIPEADWEVFKKIPFWVVQREVRVLPSRGRSVLDDDDRVQMLRTG